MSTGTLSSAGTAPPRTAARQVTTVAVVVAVLLLAWAATAGPPDVFEPVPRDRATTAPAESPSASPSPQPDPIEQLLRGEPPERDLVWIIELLTWIGVLAAAVAALALGRAMWRRRPQRTPPPPEVDFDVLPVVEVARRLAEAAESRSAELAEGDARNAIVRCWLGLEDDAASVGIERRRHETSAELTVRVLHRVDVDPAAISELASLYREARFSDHPLGDDALHRARAALERLHADLRQAAS